MISNHGRKVLKNASNFLGDMQVANLDRIIEVDQLSRFQKDSGPATGNIVYDARNFMLVTMTTTLIITVVKSSLALSLGLVGALSIIRFRAAIKEPEELSYLFLAIAIGLGFGADQRVITVVAFGIIIGIILLRHFSRRSKSEDNQNL